MKKIMDKMLELKAIPGLYEFTMENCFIAGGAVRDVNRNVEPKDYDLFFRTDKGIEEFKAKFSERMEETGLGNFNYSDFQFITLSSGTPAQVVSKFDWDVNMQYYVFGETHAKSLSYINHAGEHSLVFNVNSSYPLSAFLRLPQMLKKGYHIMPKELSFITAFLAAKGVFNSGEEAQGHLNIVPSQSMSQYSIGGAVDRGRQAAIADSPLMKALKEGDELTQIPF
jgi:hypothetical protein